MTAEGLVAIPEERIKGVLTDDLIPWFAFPMLDLAPGTPGHKVRSHILQGFRPTTEFDWCDDWYGELDKLIAQAIKLTSADPDHWQDVVEAQLKRHPAELVRHWALASGPRGFVTWTDLRDDSGERLVLKDFHVRVANALRQVMLVEILVPFMHGKSAIATGLVPFMDWAEQKECTEARIFASDDLKKTWSWVLMDKVENHTPMKRLFPWIDRPGKGNPNQKFWSSEGFNIAGRKVLTKDPSFRAMTWQTGKVGIRADRPIADDLVTDENDESTIEQDSIHSFLKSSVLTMRTRRPWTSLYGTVFGNAALIGTIYHKQDANARIQREWRGQKGKKVIRIDVYPHKDSREKGEVIWPEVRPFDYILQLEDDLGERAFKMRLRNMPGGDDGTFGFDETSVKACVSDEWAFGVVPNGRPVIIGYDPASSKGRKSKKNANPAFMVLAFGQDVIHMVAWGTWRGKTFPQKCGELAQLAHHYSCPVVVEDNNQQEAYQEQLAVDHPSVKVMCMTTGDNKRDPDSGVETWDPLFRHGKVIIHARDAPKAILTQLVGEFVDWPQANTSDLVMASWFAKRQYDLLHRYKTGHIAGAPLPRYLRNRGGLGRGVIDLRALKEASMTTQRMPWET